MASSGSITSGPASSYYYNRTITLNWWVNSQSVADNTTTIGWELKGSGGATNNWVTSGNFKVIIDGSERYFSATRINVYNGTTIASGTYTMSHDSSGNKSFSAYIEAGIGYVAVSQSASGSWSLTQIPRQANLTSAPNFDDTQNPTIGYSNPAGNAVSSLKACISWTGAADIAYRDISKTSSSYTFNLTTAERNALRQACANSKTLAVTFYVTTVIGGNTYYSTKNRTMTIVDGQPTFYMNYKDNDASVVAITQNNQLIVRNQSQLQVNITDAVAVKYATLASATCEINGTTYNGTFTGNACTFNIGTINVSSNTTATVTVIDSRGFTTAKELTISVLNWELPSAIVTMQRENNYYTPTDITVDGSYSSVDNKNSMTLQVRYKKVSDSTYSAYTTMQDNVATTFQLDNEYEWDVQVLVSDLFGSTTYNLTLSRGMPIIYFDRLLSSVGMNCFPAEEQSLEVNGANAIRSVMTRFLTADLTSLTANSYVKINLTGVTSFGGSLTATNDGGIKIGPNVSKILVSGRMLTSCSVVGTQYIRICKNNASATANMLAWVSHTNTTTSAAFETINATPALVDVQENDVIYLYYYVPASSGAIYGNDYGNQTSLTVETVA